MTRFHHPFIDRVAALELPCKEDVIITHGSALVIHGVRPAHHGGDIDLTTTRENIRYMRQVLGWEALRRTTGYDDGGLPKTVTYTMSPDGEFDVYEQDFIPRRYFATGKGRVYPEELKAHSEQDDKTGLWVARPEFVRLTKELSRREKDAEDIRLIDRYLQNHK